MRILRSEYNARLLLVIFSTRISSETCFTLTTLWMPKWGLSKCRKDECARTGGCGWVAVSLRSNHRLLPPVLMNCAARHLMKSSTLCNNNLHPWANSHGIVATGAPSLYFLFHGAETVFPFYFLLKCHQCLIQ